MGDWALAVHAAVFVAALFQAATGLGFGLLAGPVLLLVLDDVAAVQTSILLSLMIVVILAPPLVKQADRRMLRDLLIGTVVGLPVGIAIYLSVGIGTLKLLAGLIVLAMGVSVVVASGSTGIPASKPIARRLDVVVGGVSGIMTACLAMPGPAPAAWMASRAYEKAVIRSTMLTLFVPSYGLAIVLQVGVATPTLGTWSTTGTLAPAALVGLLCGKVMARRVDERIFRGCNSALLLLTAASLLISALGGTLD